MLVTIEAVLILYNSLQWKVGILHFWANHQLLVVMFSLIVFQCGLFGEYWHHSYWILSLLLERFSQNDFGPILPVLRKACDLH